MVQDMSYPWRPASYVKNLASMYSIIFGIVYFSLRMMHFEICLSHHLSMQPQSLAVSDQASSLILKTLHR